MRPNGRFTRRALVVLSPLVAAMLVLPALVLVFHTRLPDGVPDPSDATGGAGPPWLVVTGVTAGWLAVATVAIWSWLHVRRFSPVGGRWPAPFTWAAASVVCIHAVSLVVSQLDRGSAPPAALAWWATPPATAAVAIAAAGVGWALAGRDVAPADTRARPDPAAPRLDLGPHERAMWCRTVASRRTFAEPALLVVASAVALVSAGPGVVVVLFAGAAVGLALHAWVRVRVDAHGVTVSQPLLRRALVALPYRQIVQASADDHLPVGFPRGTYGVVAAGTHFGYRSRPAGPTVRLQLADGLACVLTVDDAATAAALVNTYLDRLRTPEAARSDAC